MPLSTRNHRMLVACDWCGRGILAWPSQLATGRKKCCSVACALQTRRKAHTKSYPNLAGHRAHITLAERALGHTLPNGAQVHHVDKDVQNRLTPRLVICQDTGYHRLLHARARILKAGGNPNTDRICTTCKQLVPWLVRVSQGNVACAVRVSMPIAARGESVNVSKGVPNAVALLARDTTDQGDSLGLSYMWQREYRGVGGGVRGVQGGGRCGEGASHGWRGVRRSVPNVVRGYSPV